MLVRWEWYVRITSYVRCTDFLSEQAVSKHVYRAFRGTDPDSIDN
jgi:hypothetical protein